MDDLGDPGMRAEKGRGYLVFPENAGPGPYPAVILLHSSLGAGSLEWDFARRVLAEGQAVLLVDSFTGRGFSKITDDQTAVSEVSILYDLYSAQRFLSGHSRVNADNIAAAGFSKGALPALYSSFSSIYQRFGYQNDPFSSHLAFYPWCGLDLADLRASGRPIQVHSGGADVITPAALCARVIDRVRQINPDLRVEFYMYEGMRHGFTHPGLERFSLPVGYPYPRDCRIAEQADGRFTELSSGRVLSSENLSPVIAGCSDKGAWVSGDADAAALAYDRALGFLVRSNSAVGEKNR